MNTAAENAAVTAWLCRHLPRLAAAASAHRWSHTLDAAIADIRAGTPAAHALADHHLPIDPGEVEREQQRLDRGDPGILDDLNIDRVDVTGDYTCPGRPACPRRAQPGPDGHEPRCGIFDKTMILRR
jgi:hypothetical protein